MVSPVIPIVSLAATVDDCVDKRPPPDMGRESRQKMLILTEAAALNRREIMKIPLHTKAYGYLTGRPMSRAEEKAALSELKNTSPTGSLVEALTNSARPQTMALKLEQTVDWVKLKVSSIVLSAAGEREALVSSRRSGDTTFIVECVMWKRHSFRFAAQNHLADPVSSKCDGINLKCFAEDFLVELLLAEL